MKSLQDTSIKKIFVLIKNYIRSLKPADIGAAAESHTHNYAGSSSAGGAATSANKVNKSLTVKLNSGATEGTNQFTFDGSAAKSVNITPSRIGAAAASHTHTQSQISDFQVFHVGTTAPTNTKLLWIDTANGLKYYNGSAWVTVPVAYK